MRPNAALAPLCAQMRSFNTLIPRMLTSKKAIRSLFTLSKSACHTTPPSPQNSDLQTSQALYRDDPDQD